MRYGAQQGKTMGVYPAAPVLNNETNRPARNRSVFAIDSAVQPPMCGVMINCGWVLAYSTNGCPAMPVESSSHRHVQRGTGEVS